MCRLFYQLLPLYCIILASQMSFIASNERLPVIGILGMPILDENGQETIYTKAKVGVNYLRWLEASGANTVIIHPWYNESQIDFILSRVNGVLIQGGDILITEDSAYYRIVKYIYNKIKEYNDTGSIIPLIGICHGFEMFNIIQGGIFTLDDFDAYNTPSPLVFKRDDLKKTRLFSLLTEDDIRVLLSRPVTPEFHHKGIGISNFIRNKSLHNFFKATTLALDKNAKVYVASIEAYDYPIYGLQFHPEKVSFDRNEAHNIPQSGEAISIMRKLGNFFVKEAKKNSHVISVDDYKSLVTVNTFLQFPTLLDNSYYYIFTNC